MPTLPCRLFVISASRAPMAIILRRGPTDWYHLILWDMKHDSFEHGAWFRGRIYEERCDLSPNGELFLYLALQGRKSQTNYGIAWTAVSRAPWLHALTLWPQGTTYGGGGRFLDDRRVEVRFRGLPAHPDHPLRGLEVSSGNPPHQKSTETVEGADWAGRDHHQQLIFARKGKLFRRQGDRDIELADFNGLRPDPQEAPRAAIRPLPLPGQREKRKARLRSGRPR